MFITYLVLFVYSIYIYIQNIQSIDALFGVICILFVPINKSKLYIVMLITYLSIIFVLCYTQDWLSSRGLEVHKIFWRRHQVTSLSGVLCHATYRYYYWPMATSMASLAIQKIFWLILPLAYLEYVSLTQPSALIYHKWLFIKTVPISYFPSLK